MRLPLAAGQRVERGEVVVCLAKAKIHRDRRFPLTFGGCQFRASEIRASEGKRNFRLCGLMHLMEEGV